MLFWTDWRMAVMLDGVDVLANGANLPEIVFLAAVAAFMIVSSRPWEYAREAWEAVTAKGWKGWRSRR